MQFEKSQNSWHIYKLISIDFVFTATSWIFTEMLVKTMVSRRGMALTTPFIKEFWYDEIFIDGNLNCGMMS